MWYAELLYLPFLLGWTAYVVQVPTRSEVGADAPLVWGRSLLSAPHAASSSAFPPIVLAMLLCYAVMR